MADVAGSNLDTEPTYEYVKGQGWVVTSTPTRVFEAWGCRVTLVERRPEPGEYCFMERTGTTIDMTVKCLEEEYNAWRFESGSQPGFKYDLSNNYSVGVVSSHNGPYFVITYERLSG